LIELFPFLSAYEVIVAADEAGYLAEDELFCCKN
jgi:hypothetical protein